MSITHQMSYAGCMRTTLDIDDDALAYAKERARAEKTTVGKIVSEALRDKVKLAPVESPHGFPVIRRRPGGPVITVEFIQKLLDETE
jgi:hypothetical protein